MGIYRTLNCIDYINEKPVIEVSVYSGRKGWVSFKIPIDTGFSGEILLPSDVYHELAELELPRELFPVYTTLIGEVPMRRSIALIKVYGLEFEGYIETPIYGGGKYLIGRRLLRKINIALLGRKLKTCNLKEIESEA